MRSAPQTKIFGLLQLPSGLALKPLAILPQFQYYTCALLSDHQQDQLRQAPAPLAASQVPTMGIEAVLALSLTDFDSWLKTSVWKAKENDCVNHFAHSFLARRISTGTVFYDIAQVGIEVGVPQPKGLGIKQAVRKDLVIWNAPGMTTWDSDYRACNAPLAIVEWKARKQELSERDLLWLSAFTGYFPTCFGAAVTVDFSSSGPRIHAAAVRAGVVDRNWLQQPTISLLPN